MNILIAAAEAVPFAKTGGLADVAGSLAAAFRGMGADASLIMPLYRRVRKHFRLKPLGIEFSVPLGPVTQTARIWTAARSKGVPAYFIENDFFYDREYCYGTPDGDYPDNASRFIFFSRAAIEAAIRLELAPDVIHCHDWQTALIPLYLKSVYRSRLTGTASVFTIHNLAYQGVFWHWDMPLTGVGWEHFTPEGIEFYGNINLMKAGIVYADEVTTVSPAYAREIMTHAHGEGLDGVLKTRRDSLAGILNGIDTHDWNPATDKRIAAVYGTDDLSGKKLCKAALQRECGLKRSTRAPLLGVVSRLSGQKGISLLASACEQLLGGHDIQLVVLGAGDAALERRIRRLAVEFPGSMHAHIGFSDEMAYRVYAGADMFLMPSRYEPCGLSQMIAMRYGAVPIVHKTGGLADTVMETDDGGNGFVFSGFSVERLIAAVERALEAFGNRRRWARIIGNGMAGDYSWQHSAGEYLKLYRKTFERAVGHVA